MSPIIHLTVSMLAVIYMNLGFKKRYLFIIVMMGVLPDLDHLLNIEVSGVSVAYFHNIILLLFIPLIMFLLFTMFEAGGYSSKLTRFFLAILIITTGHLVMDLVAGNVIILQASPELILFSLPQTDILSLGSIGTFMNISDLIFGSWLICVMVTRPLVAKMHSWYEGAAPDIDDAPYHIPMDDGIDPYYIPMESEGTDLEFLREMGIVPG